MGPCRYVVILLFHCLLYLSLQKKLAFAEKKNPGSYLKLINDTNGLFADGFAKFKVLRNKSAAVEYSIQDLIDHSAINYQQLRIDSASVANTVSKLWLGSAIVSYEYRSFFTPHDLVKHLKFLGEQALDLSKVFRVFATWATHMAETIHQFQRDHLKRHQTI